MSIMVAVRKYIPSSLRYSDGKGYFATIWRVYPDKTRRLVYKSVLLYPTRAAAVKKSREEITKKLHDLNRKT